MFEWSRDGNGTKIVVEIVDVEVGDGVDGLYLSGLGVAMVLK
jgi:hypothetical protein